MHSKSEFRETRCISFYSYHFSPLLRRQFANTFIVLAEKYEFEGRARKLYTLRRGISRARVSKFCLLELENSKNFLNF